MVGCRDISRFLSALEFHRTRNMRLSENLNVLAPDLLSQPSASTYCLRRLFPALHPSVWADHISS